MIEILDKLKEKYNINLKRYYNGCEYCGQHKDEIDKWMPELLRVLKNIEEILIEINKYQAVSTEEILKGFN